MNFDDLDTLDSLDALDSLDSLDAPTGPQPLEPRAHMTPSGPERGPLEEEAQQEMSEKLSGFKARAKAEAERMEQATQADYWFTAVFQTMEQASAFRAALGLPEHKYIDGYALARALNIELPPADVRFKDVERQDRKLIELIAPRDEQADLLDAL